jgi:heme A synthase
VLRTAVSDGFVRLAWTAVGAGLVLVALGAAVVSAHADEACGRDWPDCNGAFAAGGSEAWLQVAHRTAAYAVAGLALALAVQAFRGRGPMLAGTAPLVVVLAQIAIGVAMVVAGHESGAHEALAILHVAGAGAVWAVLVALAALVGLPRREHVPAALPARAR